MDIPQPDGPDVNRGTGIVIAGWTLTGVVGVLLTFRIVVKLWINFTLAQAARPRRLWGLEDVFLIAGYIVDIGHQSMIWKSYQHGLGRHFYYLTPEERRLAMKWDWVAAVLVVVAISLSRTGVMCFLYACFAKSQRHLATVLLACIGFHTAANLAVVLQSTMQCGPDPYRVTNRAAYYHYMWDPLPGDGSVVCESPKVQEYMGYGQGAFNTAIDFVLVVLSAFEVWQFLYLGQKSRLRHGLHRFTTLNREVRQQRLWQTALICGPLTLSGVACIIKSPLVGSIGNRSDITWNLMPLVLWAKIENYTIPIGASAMVMRLFIKTFSEKGPRAEAYAYGTSNQPRSAAGVVELSTRGKSVWDEEGHVCEIDVIEHTKSQSLSGSETELVDANIHIKVEYEVRTESREIAGPHSRATTMIAGRDLP